MPESIIVAIIVAVAAAYVVRRLLFKRSCRGSDCGCSSSGSKDSVNGCSCGCSRKK